MVRMFAFKIPARADIDSYDNKCYDFAKNLFFNEIL